MPSLGEHQSSDFTKLLYLGDSGTGKTGSLVSLVKAGYEIRVLDMDNGLDSLAAFVRKECPDKINNVKYKTVRDKMKATSLGPVVDGTPKAYVEATQLLTKWDDGSVPAEWGPNTFFVLDSLSALGVAAYAWADNLNPGAKDKRQTFFQGQKSLEAVIQLLTSEAFHTNVIVMTHINMTEMPDGTTRGFANALGKAMGPIIPRYFNTMIQATKSGSGSSLKRQISTIASSLVDLKNPVPFKVDATYDLGTGLATLISKLKEKS